MSLESDGISRREDVKKTDQECIASACDALKKLSDHLADQLGDEPIAADGPTQQLLARQAVVIIRQVHSIAFLVGWPYYAEQAGQLVRGLAELTRLVLWLNAPDDVEERSARAVMFWKDGIRQTRSKYEYQESIGQAVLSGEWKQLDSQDNLIAEQEDKLGREVGELPNARTMWEDLGRGNLYGLFRWESDPSLFSAVTLVIVVRSRTGDHFDLGGPNAPKDRARRLGAALLLLQLSGDVIAEGLGRDVEAWEATSNETGTEMERLLSPYLLDGAGSESRTVVSTSIEPIPMLGQESMRAAHMQGDGDGRGPSYSGLLVVARSTRHPFLRRAHDFSAANGESSHRRPARCRGWPLAQ